MKFVLATRNSHKATELKRILEELDLDCELLTVADFPDAPEVEETETSPEYREQQQLADSLHILNQFAAKYFASQLKESEEGRNNAFSYLK